MDGHIFRLMWTGFLVIFSLVYWLNYKARIISILMIPTSLKGKMRKLLIFTALLQSINGPLANFGKNVEALRKCGNCISQQFGNLQAIVQNKIESTHRLVAKRLDKFRKNIDRLASSIDSGVSEIGQAIRKINEEMDAAIDKCRITMSKPYIKCKKNTINAHKKCKKKIKLKFLCKVIKIAKKLCKILKTNELICLLGKFAKQGVGMSIESLHGILKQIKKQFRFKIIFTRTDSIQSNTRSMANNAELSQIISAAVKNAQILKHFLAICIELHGIIIFILLARKSSRFFTKFQKDASFDNFYYDEKFINKLPEKSAISMKLLNDHPKYCSYGQIQLLEREKKGLRRDSCQATLYFLLSCIYIIADELLYQMIRAANSNMNIFKQNVTDNFRRIEWFNFENCYMRVSRPNYSQNRNIIWLHMIGFVAVTFGPFIIRMRHAIMYATSKVNLKEKRTIFLIEKVNNEIEGEEISGKEEKNNRNFLKNILKLFKKLQSSTKINYYRDQKYFKSDDENDMICKYCKLKPNRNYECSEVMCGMLYCQHNLKKNLNICIKCSANIQNEYLLYPFE
ncbi:MAG: DC-STAMP-like protein [Marteilia pararefringens]